MHMIHDTCYMYMILFIEIETYLPRYLNVTVRLPAPGPLRCHDCSAMFSMKAQRWTMTTCDILLCMPSTLNDHFLFCLLLILNLGLSPRLCLCLAIYAPVLTLRLLEFLALPLLLCEAPSGAASRAPTP